MESLDHFSIPVSGLRNGLHEFDFSIGESFFAQFPASPVKKGEVAVHLDFEKRTDLYVMVFSFRGKVEVTCDRCLEQFDLPIEDRQSLLVKFDEEEWEEMDVIYILKGTQELSVAKYIYEFVNLAVPISKMHDDAGESCNPEMLKYLDHERSADEAANPFKDALKGFNLEN